MFGLLGYKQIGRFKLWQNIDNTNVNYAVTPLQ